MRVSSRSQYFALKAAFMAKKFVPGIVFGNDLTSFSASTLSASEERALAES